MFLVKGAPHHIVRYNAGLLCTGGLYSMMSKLHCFHAIVACVIHFPFELNLSLLLFTCFVCNSKIFMLTISLDPYFMMGNIHL